MGYLDYAGLQYLWGKLKEKFAPKSHSHDDRYYTEAEINGKLNSKVNNTRDGANSLINALDSGTSTPTDPDYIITQWVGGGTSNTTWVRRPASSFWTYIKSKADSVYQPKGSYAASSHTHDDRYYTESEINTKLNGKANSSHTHTKAQITDFPTSLKNPTALTIQTNGTTAATYDGSAAKTVNVTKGNIGLGNVDNTADANKSVKYATSAGSASTATKANVADSANFAKETYISQYKTVNLTDLDQNTWYPVTSTYIPYKGLRRFKCNVQLNSGSKPNWSTHSGGFTAVVDLLEESSGWGTTTMRGMVLVNDQRFIADESKPPVGYSQLGNSSIAVWWLRGGGTYFLAADYNCAWTIQKSKYENSGQSVSPTTRYPGITVNRSTIVANLDGNASTSDIATTGVRDYNNANNVIKIGWSGANLDANTLAYVAGYTSDMKIHTASKDGVRSWLGLGNVAYKNVRSLSNVGPSGWANQSTDDNYVPTMAFMAYWNGAYSGTSSNLRYCDRGRFGTIVTKNSGDYATAGHTHNSIKDAGNNSSNTTFAYSKAGMNYADYTWLAGWNGYELRAVNKSQFATAGHTHTKAQVGLGNVDNTADKNKSVASAAKLTTARTVSGGSDIILSFNYDGSGNSTANIGFYSCRATVGNTNNYLYHRFAKLDANKNAWVDDSVTFLISQDYYGGGYGICRLVYRSNADSGSANVVAEWLVRKGLSADTVQVAIKTDKTNGAYCDAFYKSSGTYMSAVIRAIASGGRAILGRTWALIDSNEVSGTTATDKKTSSECWKTIADAGNALHKQAYSASASATDGGHVASAGSANSANTATTAVKLARSGNTSYPMTFNWSGQSGQPSWLWGGNDGSNMYVYNPSNFSVNYANSAGNGVETSGTDYIRFSNGLQICWGDKSSGSSSGVNVFFPVPFSATPPYIGFGSITATQFTPYLKLRSNTFFTWYKEGTTFGKVCWVAIGKWK